MCDFSRVPEWESTVESIELETDGPTRAGTRGFQVRRLAGRHVRAPFEVVAYDPTGHLTIHSKAGPVDATGTFDCRARDDGTEVTIAMRLRLGFSMRLAEPVLRVAIERESRSNLERLKRLLEVPSE
jgi:hypothetical protein